MVKITDIEKYIEIVKNGKYPSKVHDEMDVVNNILKMYEMNGHITPNQTSRLSGFIDIVEYADYCFKLDILIKEHDEEIEMENKDIEL